MSMLRAFALTTCLLGSSLLFAADTTDLPPVNAEVLATALTTVTAPLAQAETIRGHFVQDKTLHELPRPLRSSGHFLFVRDTGIVWSVTEPFASELVITRERLIQRDGDSEVTLAASQQPAVEMIAQIFFALFSLDFDTLSSLFTLSAPAEQSEHWRFQLTPLQRAGNIARIDVQGAEDVERIELIEDNGDTTVILLDNVIVSAQPPDRDALNAFGIAETAP